MSNIKERLRSWQNHKVPIEYLREGADEIERLEERCDGYKGQVKWDSDEIERLKKAIKNEAGVELSEENDRLIDKIIELERDAAFLRAEIETLQRMRHQGGENGAPTTKE